MSFNINSTFGSSLIIWDFWTGKTFGVENICYIAKDKFPMDILLISNIPNAITDIHYNSPDDLKQILEYMFRFFIETNYDIEGYNKTYRDIILVVDEAQLYFPQDWTVLSGDKELLSKVRVILTQCRKRNVKFYLCTQRGKTVNINIRRYTDYIYMYCMQNFFSHPKFRKNTLEVYKCWGGVSDLLWEDWVSWDNIESLEKDKLWVQTMEYNSFLLDSIYKLKHYNWNLWKEKHLTQYICGLPWNTLSISSYEEFIDKLKFWKDYSNYKQLYTPFDTPLFANSFIYEV